MKLVLSRKEVRALRKFRDEISDLIGIANIPGVELLEKTISTKAYLLTMIKGELVLNVRQDVVPDLLSAITLFTSNNLDVFKAAFNLGRTLSDFQTRNNGKEYPDEFSNFIEKYSEPHPPVNFRVVSVESERVSAKEVTYCG